MSQRKEKYLRHSLEQYDGVARDVGHLMKTVPVMNRDLHKVRDAQAAMDRRAAQDVQAIYAAMERSEKRTRRAIRRENRAARVASWLAILASLVAVLALILAIHTAAAENVPTTPTVGKTAATATAPLVVIPETPAPAAKAVDGEDPLEDEKITEALLGYNMGHAGAGKLWEVGTYQSAYSREIMERAEYWAEVLEK